MESAPQSFWRKCSSCKKPIAFGARHYLCSVSTCNGQRTGYVFCSVPCFEMHLPGARHKDAAAMENTAPRTADARTPSTPQATAPLREAQRTIVRAPGAPTSARPQLPRDVLIVASRLKDYIQASSEMNTAAAVMDVLSDHVRSVCERAIDNARLEGRKTVLERDFDFLKR